MTMRIPELNNVIISGRLTKEPTYSVTQNGKGVLMLDLAVNRRYLDKATNEWKDDTVFVPVVLWGDAATRSKERLHKATPVVVEGRITEYAYTDKAGQTRKRLQITASRAQVLDTVSASGASISSQVEPQTGETVPERQIDEEEIPF